MFKHSGTKTIFALLLLLLGFAQNNITCATIDLTEGSGAADPLTSENGSGGWSNNESAAETTTIIFQEDTNSLWEETTVDAENVENLTEVVASTTVVPERAQQTTILGTLLQSTTTTPTTTTTTPEPVTAVEPVITAEPETITTTTTTTTTTEVPPSFNCTTAGNFADSENCTRYYECIKSVSASASGSVSANSDDFHLQIIDCPPYTAYSHEHGRCLRDLSTCNDDGFDCISVGRFENPLSNNSYFWCVATLHGTFYKYQVPCSEGAYFYPVLRSCWYENWTNIPLMPTINVEENALTAIKMEMKVLKTEEKMKLKAEEQQEKLLKKQQKMLEKQARKALKEQAKLAAKALSAEES